MNTLQTIKARQKATWEFGDFGQVAKTIIPVVEEFIARPPLRPGTRVLNVACGSGNLPVVAARSGSDIKGAEPGSPSSRLPARTFCGSSTPMGIALPASPRRWANTKQRSSRSSHPT